MENINDMENVCMRMSEREEFVDDEKKAAKSSEGGGKFSFDVLFI